MKRALYIGFGVIGCVALLFALKYPLEHVVGHLSVSYIKKNPAMLQEALAHLVSYQEEQQRTKEAQTLRTHQKELFSTEDGTPFLGNSKGQKAVVVFLDPFCGYCRKFKEVLRESVKTMPDLQVILRDIPIMSEKSEMLIRAMLAAKKQNKYVEMQKVVFALTPSVTKDQLLVLAKKQNLNMQQFMADMSSPETTKILEKNKHLAELLELSGTPLIVLPDRLLKGYLDLENFKKELAFKGKA